jgi:hypothetical protein
VFAGTKESWHCYADFVDVPAAALRPTPISWRLCDRGRRIA